MKGFLIVGTVFAAFAVYVLLVITSTGPPMGTGEQAVVTTTATPTVVAGPPGTPHDEAATRGGDAAPHQAENRGHRQPGDLTDEARHRLDQQGTALLPTLERVRASGTHTPAAVRAALVGAGYPAEDIGVMTRLLPDDMETEYVVFGIRADGGCVTGLVTATEVRAEAMGPYPEWGCLPPDTH